MDLDWWSISRTTRKKHFGMKPQGRPLISYHMIPLFLRLLFGLAATIALMMAWHSKDDSSSWLAWDEYDRVVASSHLPCCLRFTLLPCDPSTTCWKIDPRVMIFQRRALWYVLFEWRLPSRGEIQFIQRLFAGVFQWVRWDDATQRDVTWRIEKRSLPLWRMQVCFLWRHTCAPCMKAVKPSRPCFFSLEADVFLLLTAAEASRLCAVIHLDCD